jgi:hypothetical protein
MPAVVVLVSTGIVHAQRTTLCILAASDYAHSSKPIDAYGEKTVCVARKPILDLISDSTSDIFASQINFIILHPNTK